MSKSLKVIRVLLAVLVVLLGSFLIIGGYFLTKGIITAGCVGIGLGCIGVGLLIWLLNGMSLVDTSKKSTSTLKRKSTIKQNSKALEKNNLMSIEMSCSAVFYYKEAGPNTKVNVVLDVMSEFLFIHSGSAEQLKCFYSDLVSMKRDKMMIELMFNAVNNDTSIVKTAICGFESILAAKAFEQTILRKCINTIKTGEVV